MKYTKIEGKKGEPLTRLCPSLLSIVALWAFERSYLFITAEQQAAAIIAYCLYAEQKN